ncbi:hypothetical protein [Nocardioides sp.]|uniref:hypothetical protein n=1 Tax=Nocardioides sp. TaxID=35761 RepID=UPI002D0AEE75|nr:hypothetical protein [Nocardioides sp.]HXH79498.1 hypothetical protein [Nocardioides sp.]
MGLTTSGAQQMMGLAVGEALTNFATANAHQGVGFGVGASGAFAIAQTDLQGASKARKPVTSSTRSGSVLTSVATWAAADAVGTWDEFALFNAAAAGVMLHRGVSAGFFVKNSSTTATLTVTLTLTAA